MLTAGSSARNGKIDLAEAGADRTRRRKRSLWPTRVRQTGTVAVFVVEAPDRLAPGEYVLRMVVYDIETLAPTVEIGVWEPEVTLAQVRVPHPTQAHMPKLPCNCFCRPSSS